MITENQYIEYLLSTLINYICSNLSEPGRSNFWLFRKFGASIKTVVKLSLKVFRSV